MVCVFLLFFRVHKQVYELLEEIYYPRYHHSYQVSPQHTSDTSPLSLTICRSFQFYELYVKRDEVGKKVSEERPGGRRRGKWRPKSRHLVTAPSMEEVDKLDYGSGDQAEVKGLK